MADLPRWEGHQLFEDIWHALASIPMGDGRVFRKAYRMPQGASAEEVRQRLIAASQDFAALCRAKGLPT